MAQEPDRLVEELRRPTEMRIGDYLRIVERAGWKRLRQTGSHVIVEDSAGHTHSIPTKNGRTVKAHYLKQTAMRIEELSRG